MADPSQLTVQIDGTERLALAVALARAGVSVALVEPDPHDRQRAQDMLSRTAEGQRVTLADQDEPTVDLVLSDTPRSHAAPVLALDWMHGGAFALHITQRPGAPMVFEAIGQDPTGQVARLADALSAHVLTLPVGAIPVSERALAALSVATERLMLAGAAPVDIDVALVAAGFEIGPFEAQDLAGVDTSLAGRRAVLNRLGTDPGLPLFARAVAEGRLGRKVGVGWYRYPGNGGKVEDPLVEDMASEEAHFAGLVQTHPSPQEIVSNCTSVLHAVAATVAENDALPLQAVSRVIQLVVGYACAPKA